MELSEITPGQRVVDTGRRSGRRGEVVHVGRCPWPGCRFGDECVTVRVDGTGVATASTMNYRAGALRPE